MVKKPRICFVGPMLGEHPGWVPNPAENLAPRLSELGFACSLVSHKFNRFHRLADIVWTLLRKRDQLDIICLQVYAGPSFVVEDCASWLSQRMGIPIVMVLHGGAMHNFLTRFPRWGKRVLGRAHTLVAPSRFLAQAVEVYGFQARVIPNAIETDQYQFRLRHTANPKILWMRTFHEIYNPLLAVEVIRELRQSYPQATLTMAGQDKGMFARVQQRVQELGLKDAVRMMGFLDMTGKQHEFAAHDIFLNTNHIDNQPISVVEAAASGMPIVATRVGGLPYLLTDGQNGLLTADNDAVEMVTAVRRILEESGLAVTLSSNAMNLGKQHDWSVVLAQWDALFQTVFRK